MPFTVQLTVTNTTATTWTGTIGVGLYGTRTDPTFGRELLFAPHLDCSEASPYWFEHGALRDHWIQGITDPTRHRVRPGRTIIVVIFMVKGVNASPQAPVQGWIPVLNPIDPHTPSTNPRARYPDPATYSTVDWQ
jgi:hypothetical protein